MILPLYQSNFHNLAQTADYSKPVYQELPSRYGYDSGPLKSQSHTPKSIATNDLNSAEDKVSQQSHQIDGEERDIMGNGSLEDQIDYYLGQAAVKKRIL